MPRIHVVVHGLVQGVGYRWFVRDQARRLALGGWVLNNRDGTVELEAEGGAESIESLLKALRDGHPHARVERLVVKPAATSGRTADFEIRAW